MATGLNDKNIWPILEGNASEEELFCLKKDVENSAEARKQFARYRRLWNLTYRSCLTPIIIYKEKACKALIQTINKHKKI
ncbi:hypothetical protein SAMN05216383_10897 [Prevotella sp. KH2C16]|nr:hypothetical protein SAMN05216383_10897 [Prevotella sp. KH2C16]